MAWRNPTHTTIHERANRSNQQSRWHLVVYEIYAPRWTTGKIQPSSNGGAAPGLHVKRVENRVSYRFSDLCSVFDSRYGHCKRNDVDGNDHALTFPDFPSIQTSSICSGWWMAIGCRYAHAKFPTLHVASYFKTKQQGFFKRRIENVSRNSDWYRT